MSKQDFILFTAALRTYYPRYDLFPNEQAMDLWYAALGDLSYQTLSAALRKWVVTEKWPPSIAELRALSAEIEKGKAPDWGEGWNCVQRAIARYGYNREREALESLPPLARQAAERLGWRSICESENPDTLRAQFRQCYEICEKREREDRQIPPSLREAITMIGQASAPQQLTGGN